RNRGRGPRAAVGATSDDDEGEREVANFHGATGGGSRLRWPFRRTRQGEYPSLAPKRKKGRGVGRGPCRFAHSFFSTGSPSGPSALKFARCSRLPRTPCSAPAFLRAPSLSPRSDSTCRRV